MLTNLTLASLFLDLSVGKSPLLALSRPTSVNVFNSRFARLLHPVVFSPSACRHIPLSSQPELMSSLPSQGSTVTGGTHQYTGTYTILENGTITFYLTTITLRDCVFTNCLDVCFNVSSALFRMQGGKITNGAAEFAVFEDAPGESTMTDVTASQQPTLLHLTSSRLIITTCVFTVSADPFAAIEAGSELKLASTTLTKETQSIATVDGVSTLILSSSSFAMRKPDTGVLITRTDSYLVIDHCCFVSTEDGVYQSDTKVAVAGRGNNFGKPQCPYVDPTATLSKQQRAFAITTVAVFFAFFTILFIVLIAYVACKAGADKAQQYGELHPVSDDGSDDEVIPSD